MPFAPQPPKRISKNDLPEEIDVDKPVYELIYPFYHDKIYKPTTLFQLAYINQDGYHFTTIGVMSMNVFERIAKCVYVPDVNK